MLTDIVLSNMGLQATLVIMSSSGLVFCILPFLIKEQPESEPQIELEPNQDSANHVPTLTEDERRGSLIYVGDLDNIGNRRSSISCNPKTTQTDENLHDANWLEQYGRLLKNPILFMFLLAFLIHGIVFYLPSMFLFKFFEEQGIEPTQTKAVMPAMAITGAVGRLMIGFFVDQPWMDALMLEMTCSTVASALSMIIAFCSGHIQLMVTSILFSTCHYTIYSTASVVLVDLFGLKLLTKTFGLLQVFLTVGLFLGQPLAGHLFDVFSSFQSIVFLISGTHLACAICLMIMKALLMKSGNPTTTE